MRASIASIAFLLASTAEAESAPPPDSGWTPPAAGTYGAACAVNEDCLSGYCVESPSNGNLCTETCIDACPGGWHCSPVPVAGSEPTFICTPLGLAGAACSVHYACKSNWCLASKAGPVCVDPCAPSKLCPSGTSCQPVSGAQGGDLCLPDGSPMPKMPGDACAHDYDCASQHCAKYEHVCTQLCSADACQKGWWCDSQTYDCLPLKATGDKCWNNVECQGGYCIPAAGGSWKCSEACVNECADAWTCEAVDGVMLCVEYGTPPPVPNTESDVIAVEDAAPVPADVTVAPDAGALLPDPNCPTDQVADLEKQPPAATGDGGCTAMPRPPSLSLILLALVTLLTRRSGTSARSTARR